MITNLENHMLEEDLKHRILRLIKREVVPAIGCTEPVAVALAVARAVDLYKGTRASITKISCRLSANIVKNAMGVGIPGTGMIGLPIAVALGALVGRHELGLEVLNDVNAEAVKRGKELIDKGIIEIELFKNAPHILHIDITVSGPEHHSRAVISGGHTNFVHCESDGTSVDTDSKAHETS